MMKKSIIAKAMLLAFSLFAASCSDEVGGFGSGKGCIAPTVGCDNDVEGMGQTLSRAAGDITVDDLSLTLSKDDGSYRQTWDKISDFDTEKQFSVGSYTLTAFYGDPEDEGFDKPAFTGSVPVKVADGQTSRVSLTATVANSKISVVYSDAFKKYMADYSGQFVTAKSSYDYAKDEVRPLHVAPGQVTFNVHVVKPNGNEATFEVAKINTEARHHYVITVDLNSGNVSDAVLEVTFDDTLEQEPVTIDLSDEILTAPLPQIFTEGFTPGTPLELMAGVDNKVKVQYNLQAMAGFKSVTLNTESEYLNANGWPATIDLLAATDAEQAMMKARGLRVVGLWGTVGTMALLDFSSMPEYMVAGDARFTVSITDAFGRTLESPVSLEFNLFEVGFELSATDDTYFSPGTPVTFNLTTNTAVTQDKLKVEYKNSRGTTGELTITDFVETSSRNASYDITVIAPTDVENALTLKLSCGRIGSNELTILPTPFDLSFAENDIFATHAYMDILPTVGNAAPDLSIAQIILCNADGSFTPMSATAESSNFNVTALSADTQYTVRAKIGKNYSKAHTFHTEKAAQIPGSGMENWSATKKGDYQYLWTTDSPWNTVNELTCSNSGNGSGSGVNTGGCAYKATSGTIPANGRSTYSNSYGGTFGTTKKADGHTVGNATLHSNKGHSGNAALIRTVGYGSGNNAGSGTGNPASGFSTCQNVAAGELYLGEYNNGAQYTGTAFTSRPSALSFYYHYTSYGSSGDYGDCEIIVKDASGNTIASARQNLTKQDNYTKITLPLTYTNRNKAAKIMVRFKSSANPSLTNSSTWLYGPGNKNVSGGEYVGSELYIDDIELTY